MKLILSLAILMAVAVPSFAQTPPYTLAPGGGGTCASGVCGRIQSVVQSMPRPFTATPSYGTACAPAPQTPVSPRRKFAPLRRLFGRQVD